MTPTPSLPVFLFLDFDGVLRPFFTDGGRSTDAAPALPFLPAFEAAVRACPRPVAIVIASTWRNRFNLAQLRARFSDDIQPLIVGVTPVVQGSHGPGGRLAEARRWLADRGHPTAPWVAVDDMVELYGEGAVVHCHDRFAQREHALLIEAVSDPAAFERAHPCPSPSFTLQIVTAAGPG